MPLAMCCSQFAIKKLETMLNESMAKLPVIVPFKAEDCTKLAWIIYNSMTTNGRVYHAMSHVFDISKNMNGPILILSALCHDVIYFQIDKAFDEEQAKALEGVLVMILLLNQLSACMVLLQGQSYKRVVPMSFSRP
jgi:hypothetical protein